MWDHPKQMKVSHQSAEAPSIKRESGGTRQVHRTRRSIAVERLSPRHIQINREQTIMDSLILQWFKRACVVIGAQTEPCGTL